MQRPRNSGRKWEEAEALKDTSSIAKADLLHLTIASDYYIIQLPKQEKSLLRR